MSSRPADRDSLSSVLRRHPAIEPGGADDLATELATRYSEPHRRYHTLQHLAEVLSALDALRTEAADVDCVRLAALYHDAVYDPLAGDNERRSADLAADRLTASGLDGATVSEVGRLIELTAGHDVSSDDANGAVLIDADLAILAASTDRYDEYRQQIRAEFGAVDDASFTAGRIRVLEGFAERPVLFNTSIDRPDRDARARENLARELAALRSSTG